MTNIKDAGVSNIDHQSAADGLKSQHIPLGGDIYRDLRGGSTNTYILVLLCKHGHVFCLDLRTDKMKTIKFDKFTKNYSDFVFLCDLAQCKASMPQHQKKEVERTQKMIKSLANL